MGLIGLVFVLPRLLMEIASRSRILTIDEIKDQDLAIVFGAGLERNGKPTDVLKDRIETAVALYQQGKVIKLLMSGDNRFVHYDEPTAMKDYAMELGVPEDDIVLDFAGRRTYDTCYRAKHIFGVDKAILVTQDYHLPRALFTCKGVGIDSVGVDADQRYYLKRSRAIWYSREVVAAFKAWLDVSFIHPLPVLGDPEPILFD
ncbi:MAG: YdcF family protein [Anaerolineales bacterium]|nr:YdcF family protein [Anaerolineales bacterium]